MTTITAQTTQVYQVFIKATPEQIWQAITTPEWTQKYFYGVSIDARNGRRVVHGADDALWSDDPLIEEDPPRRLVHSWISTYDPEMAAEEPSRVTWEIEPQEGGFSKLTVVHDQLEGAPKTAEGVSGEGWMMVLSGLKTVLETGEPLSSS